MAGEKSRVKYKPYVYEMMGVTLIKSLSGCLSCAVSAVKARNIGSFHFFIRTPPPPPPLRMARFRPLKVLAAPFEEKNLKGSFFGGTFVKNFRRVHFLAAPLI